MKRNIVILNLITVVLFSLTNCNVKNEITSSENPNIIFLVVDDMNDFAITKEEKVLTPNLDQLRNNSITFTNANCQAPLCVPSRVSFFTGLYPHETGAYMNGGDPWNQSKLLQEAVTLPELFSENGYYSFGAGKIYHARLPEGRMERNFDNHPIFRGGFGPFPDEEHRLFSEKDKFPTFWGTQSFPDSLFPDVKNTDASIEFLKQEHNDPFFLALGYWRPHTPFTAPERFFELYDPDNIRIPEGYLSHDLDDVPEYMQQLLDPFGRFEITGASNVEQWKRFIHAYYACTSFVDWNIGRLVSALDESPYADNTILIIISDNGFHIGEKNHWEKNTLWNTSAVVPFIIRMPEGYQEQMTVNTPIELIDIYPTLVELCNLQNPTQKLSGKSLVPFIKKPGFTWDKPALTSLGKDMISVQTDEYRYIQYPDGSEELYNYKSDPYEWENVINDSTYNNLLKELRSSVPDKFADELPGGRKN